MITKITKGRAWKTAALYLINGSGNAEPGRGKLLATNFAGADAKAWSREFAAFRKLKPNLSRAIAHISLSLHPEDRAVGDEEFIAIAQKVRAGLDFTDDCPFIVVRHFDREHQHIHLLLSRISANGSVVAETNDFRRAEKLAATLREEYGLRGPATRKKNNNEKESAMKQNYPPFDDRKILIEERLEDAVGEIESKIAADKEPEAPSIGPAGEATVKEIRDLRREILTQEYQRAMNDIFLEQLRYVRKSSKALTLYFKDGSHLHDGGDRLRIYGVSDPAVAAARLVEVAVLKGWGMGHGIVLRGSDEFLREAAILAINKNLRIVPVGAHQIAIINKVRQSLGLRALDPNDPTLPAPALKKSFPAPAPPASVAPPVPPNPVTQMTGKKRLEERLLDRRRAREEGSGKGSPPSTPAAPRRRGP